MERQKKTYLKSVMYYTLISLNKILFVSDIHLSNIMQDRYMIIRFVSKLCCFNNMKKWDKLLLKLSFCYVLHFIIIQQNIIFRDHKYLYKQWHLRSIYYYNIHTKIMLTTRNSETSFLKTLFMLRKI